MTQATTTFSLIRAQIVTVIEGLTPAVLNRLENRFRRCPDKRMLLTQWALTHGADNCFRKFDVRISGDVTDPEVFDTTIRRVTQPAEVIVAYPVAVALYGAEDIDDMEDVIESDATQVRDAVFSPGNTITGHVANIVTTVNVDRTDDRVWFQKFTLEVIYYKAQAIT